ncbi:RNA 2',3'-cyclic phosphodiesterase [Zoogloea sp.]|uniref:RNA 2',3'-cyclic phosphodiesterase n=1 Tax=Zoogloea sp. TaxID=49181 RepID=UPI001416528C|nr:MAG: RNA 2',3'-cyclic phosphodiesterase [Zoogloea sp.]
MAETTRRLFLALWPGLEQVRQLDRLAGIAEALGGGRRMRPETLHMTLAFLGEVAESRIPDLCGVMAECEAEPFALEIDQLGYWPANHILWAGCRQPPAQLGRLVAGLQDALGRVGLSPARRDFFPHVTLLRKAQPVQALPEPVPIAWPVDEWWLVESRRDAGAGAYHRLAAWPTAPVRR